MTARLLASADPGDRAELQWRLSLPLMVPVLALWVPISATALGENKSNANSSAIRAPNRPYIRIWLRSFMTVVL